MNTHKTYTDKSVQTGSGESPSRSRIVGSPSALPQHDALCNHKALDGSQLSESSSSLLFSDDSGAYTYSEVSLFDQSRYLSDCPTVGNRRVPKYGQLGYGTPSHLASISDRIASLPETSPPYRLAQEQTARLVSMPEDLQVLHYPHDPPARYLDCNEHYNASLGSSKSTDAEHAFVGEVPQTPSPPTSPESVMIIGNENRVSQTFLRPRSIVRDGNDRGDWPPWKGSPPKPIPALHGPLSLPYARCPSGAEGTVIEGEDLTHMIWGLDSNGTQLAQAKNHSSSIESYKSLPHPIPSSRTISESALPSRQDQIAQALYNQDVIDLARPEFQAAFCNRVNSVQHCRPPSTYLSSVDDGQLSRKDVRSKKLNIYELVRRDSPIQLYPNSFGHLNAGLGIDLWRGSVEAGTFISSDGALIPHDNRESPLVLGQALEMVHPTQIYQTPRNLPIHERRSSEHRGHGQCPEIPTPPDTGSPQWSPRFSHSHFTATSPEIHYDQIPYIHHGYLQRPVPNSTRDSFISSHQIQERLTAIPNCHSRGKESFFLTGEVHRLPPPYRSPESIVADHSSTDGHDDDIQYPPKPRLPQIRLDAHNDITPPSPLSPELRRNLSQKQPRSIPLARLIQRRLSSVIEEDVDVEGEAYEDHKHAPALSPPRPSQGSECSSAKTERAPKEGTGESHLQGRKVAVAITPPAGASNDRIKRAYRPPGHPSRCAPSGTRDTLAKSQKPSMVDQSTTLTNRSGENAQKTNAKSKKTSRKKRYAKKQEKQDVAPALNKQT